VERLTLAALYIHPIAKVFDSFASRQKSPSTSEFEE
jgi:hypothetical protein